MEWDIQKITDNEYGAVKIFDPRLKIQVPSKALAIYSEAEMFGLIIIIRRDSEIVIRIKKAEFQQIKNQPIQQLQLLLIIKHSRLNFSKLPKSKNEENFEKELEELTESMSLLFSRFLMISCNASKCSLELVNKQTFLYLSHLAEYNVEVESHILQIIHTMGWLFTYIQFENQKYTI
ncbi:hypothetical protein Glove_621g25 [Diversispora epigaea]|uniref:Uncharacterized protein n=1 Tax=Diversispora epigaea TaxID=1348612 RepID=A0A397GAN1_9GLOM|nr:hypothetical protein Glove_621g25 [Diversispora epigaea]